MATIAELLVEIGVDVKDAEKAEKRIKAIRKETDKLGDTAVKETRRASSAFTRFGRVAGRVTGRVQGAVLGLDRAFSDLAKPIGAAIAAITAAAGAVFAFVNSQTAALDATAKLSESLGLNVEELQRLEFAATQSGAGQDQLRQGIQRLNTQFLDVRQGGGQAFLTTLEDLNLNINDLNQLSQTQRIGAIGDALQRIGDDGQRAALASRVFGEESGPRLASLLAEGTEGITALTESADGVFTADQIAQATLFQDTVGEVRNEIGALTKEVALELLPTVQDAIDRFGDWFDANEDLIRQAINTFFDLVAESLARLADQIDTVTQFANILGQALDALGVDADSAGAQIFDLANTLGSLLSPIAIVTNAIEGLIDSLIDLDLVSDQVEGGSITQISRRAGRAAGARARELRRQGARGASGLDPQIFGPVDDPAARRRAGRAGGGGGGGARQARPKPRRPTPEGVTASEAIRALLTGDADVLGERFREFAPRTPSVRDVKPTVAITFFNMQNEFNITAPSPEIAAQQVVRQQREQIQRAESQAALALQGTTVIR